MLEAGSCLSVSQSKLPIRVAATNKDIALLSQQNRVVLTSSDCLDWLSKEVLNDLWLKDVLRGTMSKLALLSIAKSE